MTADELRAGWAALKRDWSRGWAELERWALDTYAEGVESGRIAYAEPVKAFHANLEATRANLDAMDDLVTRLPDAQREAYEVQLDRMEQRYNDLGAGFYSDAQPRAEVGVAPVVVGAGLVIGVAGICWALAAQEYCANLRDQTQLSREELAARVKAMESGTILQQPTVPPPGEGMGLGGTLALAMGGLVLVGGALLAAKHYGGL